MTDSKSVADAGSSFVRTADSWALIASNELPRSRNSSPGRSSATSSSPRPSRFRPLWITWIGRSIHCDSSVATKVETRSAMSAVDAARVRTVRISLRTADVEHANSNLGERLLAGKDRHADLEPAVRGTRP